LIQLYFFAVTVSPLSFLKSSISFIMYSSHALYNCLNRISKNIKLNLSSSSYTCYLSPRGYFILMIYVPKNKEFINDSSLIIFEYLLMNWDWVISYWSGFWGTLYFSYYYRPSSKLAKK